MRVTQQQLLAINLAKMLYAFGRAVRPPFFLMNAVIVHFNTPELTRATIKSIWKHTPECKVTIFDNSTELPFGEMDGVSIIDNTRGQLIDFDAFLAQFPDKVPTTNEWGSAKHTKTIDYLFGLFPAGFVLLDSDVLVKRDLNELVDETRAYVGEPFQNLDNAWQCVARLLPFCCWINVPMCRRAGIHYFDPARTWQLKPSRMFDLYDTGASFYEDCVVKKLPYKNICIDDYIEHLGASSYLRKDPTAWLEKYRNLYE